ncbi:MAG: ribosome biogenesis GTPase Der [Candidatus Peribacteraceae bacterium]|nr:ribosome biogenesis GTPase Der [Candidatus Peribacteraceae bacterium]MDD5742936.1 ribosome biogenesis GTPase Der [Candidatus Peribacteraceae bacterium]
MPSLPTVAIIGRPNTGKSTLFNRLAGERKAIESEVAGTTRDHVAHRIATKTVDFLLLDTGGMGGGTDDKGFEQDVHRQSLLALENADLIVFTINSREELTKSDHVIIDLLRKRSRRHVPVILVPTKCDNPATIEGQLVEYLSLGIADIVIPVSAPHAIGTEELLEAIVKELKRLHFKKQEKAKASDPPKVAVIGKPNVGKSSLINAFMSDPQRAVSPMLVSDIPGTTRDAVDTIIRFNEQEFLFIDTAGIRRRTKVEEGIEHYAVLRSIQALEQCDVALLVLSATEPVSHQDQRLAALAIEAGKGLILLLNKIDTLKSEAPALRGAEGRAAKIAEVELSLSFCRFAPLLPCSAQTRDGLLRIFPLIAQVQQNRRRRIPTKELHRWFTDAVYGQPLKVLSKTKHLTQADDVPPTFVLFVKNPRDIRPTELRFLENRLRSMFDFTGTPVRWIAKGGKE